MIFLGDHAWCWDGAEGPSPAGSGWCPHETGAVIPTQGERPWKSVLQNWPKRGFPNQSEGWMYITPPTPLWNPLSTRGMHLPLETVMEQWNKEIFPKVHPCLLSPLWKKSFWLIRYENNIFLKDSKFHQHIKFSLHLWWLVLYVYRARPQYPDIWPDSNLSVPAKLFFRWD